MTLHFSLAFEEIAKSPGSRLLRLVYNVIGVLCQCWPPFPFSNRSARALKGELSAPCVLRRATAHRNIRGNIPHCHVGVLMLGCVYMTYIQYMNALGGPWEHVETNNISESIFS